MDGYDVGFVDGLVKRKRKLFGTYPVLIRVQMFLHTGSQVSDVVSDVLVTVELGKVPSFKVPYQLSILFLILPFIVTWIMLFWPFVSTLKDSSYLWIGPYLIFGIPLLIVYDIGINLLGIVTLGKWQPKQEGKLYQLTRHITEVWFEALPQLFIQVYILQNASGSLNLDVWLFYVSIGMSLLNVIKAVFFLRSFSRYMKVQASLRGAIVGLREESAIELNMVKRNMGPKETKILCDAIMENYSLKTLLLNHNECGPEGASYIAQVLGEHRSLRDIHFRNNEICDLGCIALAAGIKYSCALRFLDISNNNINDEGILSLSKGIQENETMTKLRLDENNITDVGAEYLANALQNNTKLEKLLLRKNQISEKGKTAIDEKKKNQRLEVIYEGMDSNLQLIAEGHFAL